MILLGMIFFSITNPKNVPPVVLVVGFLLLTGIIYSFLRLIAKLFSLKERLTVGQYKGLLIGGTALPVMMLALQSIGQLTVRDSITLVILFIAGYFYISRISARQ